MDLPHIARERDFAPVADALVPVLHALPGKLVAIDGPPGVGKTSLGRFLAWRFNVSLIEADLFMIEGQGKPVHRTDEIARIIDMRLRMPRPVIIEGITVLRLLASLGRSPDFTIYVTNKNAPKSHGSLAADLADYRREFSPRERASITVALNHDG